jgi:dienelactone hydrolase
VGEDQGEDCQLKIDFEDTIVSTLKATLGADVRIGCLGFCWGGWMVTHAASLPSVCAVAACHPSPDKLCKLLGEDFEEVCKGVSCPVLMCPAKDDGAGVKTGGLMDKVVNGHGAVAIAVSSGKDTGTGSGENPLLGDVGGRATFLEFPRMNHGWVTRGPAPLMPQPATSQELEYDRLSALNAVEQFMAQHLHITAPAPP